MLDIMGLEEYNNVGALFGIDSTEGKEFYARLQMMDPVKKVKLVNKLANTGTGSRGSRAEMEKHFGELPAHIKESLVKGELRLADTVIYSIKPVTSRTTKLWETQDQKAVGLNSLSSARLPKNSALLVSGITILAGVPLDITPEKVTATKFEGLENFGVISNGEFSLKSNKKIILPETSMSVFKTANNHQIPLGYYKLANPRLIHDDILIEATVELGSMEGLDPKTHLFIGLHGTITTP